MEGLERLMKGRDGIVVEQGRHDDLLALDRIYAGLYWPRPVSPASQRIQLTEGKLVWPAR